jgi:glycine/D-amino acid oxidase-like deaminating enzyme
LTRHPKFDAGLHRITLLEATAIAANASGKAGGLLALWAYPECLVPLSYRLHRELAQEHGGAERWGYRRVTCGELTAVVTEQSLQASAALRAEIQSKEASQTNGNGTTIQDDAQEAAWAKLPKQDAKAADMFTDSLLPADLDWVDANVIKSYKEMGAPGSTETAQVHPYLFTTSMAELARQRGVDIRLKAKVTRINHSDTAIRNVEYEDRDTGKTEVLDGVTDVVLAAGPWTGRVMPRTRIEGLRSHSIVYDADVSPYAVFTSIKLPPNWVPENRLLAGQKRKHMRRVDPEIYARPSREVYACG